MHLKDAQQDYILHITHERRLARKTTCIDYANDLHQLHEWYKASGYLERNRRIMLAQRGITIPRRLC